MKYEKTIVCQLCGQPFISHNATGRYCQTCRKEAYRQNKNAAFNRAQKAARAARIASALPRPSCERKPFLSIAQADAIAKAHGLSLGHADERGLLNIGRTETA